MSAPLSVSTTLAIAGYVDDAETGAPVDGALVTIGAGPPAFEARRAILAALPGWSSAGQRLDRTSTRVDGRFVFVNLPDGSYTLQVSAPRQPGRYAVASVTATAGPAGAPVTVQLQPAQAPAPPGPPPQTARIFGRVVRRSSRLPIAGALVRVRGTDHAASTDADGHYAIDGVPLGQATVEVAAEHHDSASRQIQLAAGEQRQLHIQLRRPRGQRAARRPPQARKPRT